MKILLAALILATVPASGQFSGPFFGPVVAKPTSGTPQVATPTFSPAAGTYSSTQTVTISTATSLAVLCYTTDGSTPTETANSCSGGTTTTYSTPITVSTTQTVKALGTLATYTDSAVGSAAYTIGGAAPAIVNSWVKDNESGGSTTVTVAPTTGDQLTVCGVLTSPRITWTAGCTDNHSNALSADFTQQFTANSSVECWSETAPASTTSVTCIPDSSSAYVGMIAVDVSNMATAPSFDAISTVYGSPSGTNTSWTTNSVTPTFSGHNLLFGFFVTGTSGSAWSAQSPYTAVNHVSFVGGTWTFFIESNVQIGTASATATGNLSPTGTMDLGSLATYKGSN